MTVFDRFDVLYSYHRQTRRWGLSFFMAAGRGSASGCARYIEKGLIKIANEKRRIEYQRVDYSKIRAEYVAGGTSYAKLAKKYGVSATSIGRRSRSENWLTERENARVASCAQIIRKTSDFAAENAVRAQRIKAKLLERLESLTEAHLRATEVRSYDLEGNLTEINRLRDLTSAYKDLTGDTLKLDAAEEELDRARDILGGVESVIE